MEIKFDFSMLRGKIREANNVVTLYCPIADKITLDCKI